MQISKQSSHPSGIAETVCVLFFANALGRWVDRAPSRLRVLLLTIMINRISILISCIIWFTILSFSYPTPKRVFFALALFLGMIEKLSRGANILSMERDWVPTLANISADAKHPAPFDLTHLNTTMRRIDMLCKLIAPLAISTFVSTIKSERIAVVVLATISLLSVGPECWGVLQVWQENRRLRARKERVDDAAMNYDQDQPMQLNHTDMLLARQALGLYRKITLHIMGSICAYIADLGYYFRTSVWIPSLCAAVPHASVLTFTGTMLTYLLNAGYSLDIVTVAKASGAVFEIGSTFLFPWAVGTLSKANDVPSGHNMSGYHEVEQREPLSRSGTDLGEAENDRGQNESIAERSVIRVGYWALGGLFLSLVSRVGPSQALFRTSTLIKTSPDPSSPQRTLARCTPSCYRTQRLQLTSISRNIPSAPHHHAYFLHLVVISLPLDLRPLRYPIDTDADTEHETFVLWRH